MHSAPSSETRLCTLVLRLVLVGSCGSWLAGQAVWIQRNPANTPPPRLEHGLAHDASRGATVLFGGFRLTTLPGQLFDDTWAWNGTDWKVLKPTRRPAARRGHTMAYDAARQRIVLFGGDSGSVGQFSDTWEWDGTNWTDRKPKHSPVARSFASMAYDPIRRRIVLFGGTTGFLVMLSDTWEWDGTDWQQVSASPTPTGRTGAAMAYDVAGKRMILYGGHTALGGTYLGDTWAYDGRRWTRLNPASAPGPRNYTAAAYDTLRDRLVVFGGADARQLLNETWEWTGNTWTRRETGVSPQARAGARAVFDAKRDRVLLFGGSGQKPNRELLFFNDTWELSTTTPASFGVFGAGCKGSAGTPTLTQISPKRPWLGETLQLRLTALPGGPAALNWGFSRTSWGSVPLPLDLTRYGMPGCQLLVSPDTSGIPLRVTNNEALWAVKIPAVPILSGLSFYLQGYASDPRANAWGVVVSNGYEARLGIR
jgi:hypothetical protein